MNKQISTGWGVAAVVVVAIIIGFALWIAVAPTTQPLIDAGIENSMQGKIQNQNPVNNVSKADQKSGQQSGPIIYKNDQYGFQITLPKGFEKYKAVSNKEGVKIYLPTTDKKWVNSNNEMPGYAPVAGINVWTIAAWNKEKNSADCKGPVPGCPDEDAVLGKNSKYVFEPNGPQDVPEDLRGVDFSTETVFKNFELLKK